MVFKPGSSEEHVKAHLSAVNGMLAADSEIHSHWHIPVAHDCSKEFRGYHITVKNSTVKSFITTHSAVAFVEQNAEVKPDTECLLQSGATWGLARTSTVSNDKNGYYSYGTSSSSSVNVYVIDTGIRTSHEDFEGRAVWGADMVMI